MVVPKRDLFERKNFIPFFVTAELLLALAIPFILINAYHTFLQSDAGTFITEVTPSDPGWRSFVEHTKVTPLVERDESGELRQLSLLIDNPALSTVVSNPASPTSQLAQLVTIPTSGVLEEMPLKTLSDTQIHTALEATFQQAMEPATSVNIGESISYASILTESATVETSALASQEQSIVDVGSQESIEFVKNLIAFPAASDSAPMVRVRVISAAEPGQALVVAEQVAGLGFEISEIGNANVFTDVKTQLSAPTQLMDTPQLASEIERLSTALDVGILADDIDAGDDAVTILVGSDFSLASN